MNTLDCKVITQVTDDSSIPTIRCVDVPYHNWMRLKKGEIVYADKPTEATDLWEHFHVYFASENCPALGEWFYESTPDCKGTRIRQFTKDYNPDIITKYHKSGLIHKVEATTDTSLKIPLIQSDWVQHEFIAKDGNINSVTLGMKKDIVFYASEYDLPSMYIPKLTENNEVIIVGATEEKEINLHWVKEKGDNDYYGTSRQTDIEDSDNYRADIAETNVPSNPTEKELPSISAKFAAILNEKYPIKQGDFYSETPTFTRNETSNLCVNAAMFGAWWTKQKTETECIEFAEWLHANNYAILYSNVAGSGIIATIFELYKDFEEWQKR